MTVAQKSLADKLIKQPFADTDLNESTLRWSLDFEVHNMFAILVKWSKNKRTATLEHIDVANLRTNADMSKFAYTRKWYIIKQGKRIENKNFEKEPDYKVYDGYDANDREGEQIYFYAAYHPDQYVYALPQYRGALTWIENHIAYSDFQYTNITASFAPMINAKFFGNIPDDEKQQEITESFTKNFTSPEGKRLMVGFYQSIEQAAAIDPINVPDQSTLYKEIADQSEYNILASHEFPKLLLGISTEGALGQRNELATMEESYYNRYVISRQRCLEYAINEIVDDIGLPITLKLKRVKSVDWMPSDATIERILGDERLTEYVIDRLGVKNKQSYAFNKATMDANLAVFMKYGVDANKYEVLSERDVLSFDADEIAASEQEFMTFAKAEIKSLDRVVLDLLSKDPAMPPNLAAKETRLGLTPDFIGAFKFEPSLRL